MLSDKGRLAGALMKTTKLILTLLPLGILAAQAQAGLYVRGGLLYYSLEEIKVSAQNLDYQAAFDDAVGFNVAVGMKVSALRIEGEVNYLGSDISNINLAELATSGDYERMSFFANALFEIPFTPLFEPYIGAGVGVTDVSVDFMGVFTDGSDTIQSSADNYQLSYQVMAGVRLSVMDTVSIYAGYRYVNIDGLAFSDEGYELKASNGSHIFEVGVGIGF